MREVVQLMERLPDPAEWGGVYRRAVSVADNGLSSEQEHERPVELLLLDASGVSAPLGAYLALMFASNPVSVQSGYVCVRISELSGRAMRAAHRALEGHARRLGYQPTIHIANAIAMAGEMSREYQLGLDVGASPEYPEGTPGNDYDIPDPVPGAPPSEESVGLVALARLASMRLGYAATAAAGYDRVAVPTTIADALAALLLIHLAAAVGQADYHASQE